MKEICATIMTNPGLLDNEYKIPNGYRYLITVEKPLTIDQVKLLCELLANLRGDAYAFPPESYGYQRTFTCILPVIERDKP